MSKFEGRGDFLLSTLCKYAQALSARVELSIHLDGGTFDSTPYEDEGQMCFRLAKRHTKKIAAESMLNTIHLLSELSDHPVQMRESNAGGSRRRSGHYRSERMPDRGADCDD